MGLAAHAGAGKAGSSVLDKNAAPLNAMLAALSGNVDLRQFDIAEDSQRSADLPHLAAPIVAMSAKDGFGVDAGKNFQIAGGETVSLIAGKDVQSINGGQVRIHSGQVIGMLGGAVDAGAATAGLQLIAARDVIDIQAQADELKIRARDEISVISANAHIDWAAAKSIILSTAGGASIVIDGGNINVVCPGKIIVNAGKKSLSGAYKLNYPLPDLPTSICVECLIRAGSAASPFVLRSA